MLPPAAERVVAAAAELGLEIDVLEFPEGTKTARDAAAAIGCELGQIVKSLVFMADERPVLALVPGDLRLDPRALAEVVGAEAVRRATLEEVRSATSYAAGGTPPFGHDLPTLASTQLGRFEQLYAAAGTPTTVFGIKHSDLLRVTEASTADLT